MLVSFRIHSSIAGICILSCRVGRFFWESDAGSNSDDNPAFPHIALLQCWHIPSIPHFDQVRQDIGFAGSEGFNIKLHQPDWTICRLNYWGTLSLASRERNRWVWRKLDFRDVVLYEQKYCCFVNRKLFPNSNTGCSLLFVLLFVHHFGIDWCSGTNWKG